MPVKPQDPNSRASASAVDADQHLQGQNAAQSEQDRIDSWANPSFAQVGRHQSQKDPEFGFKERKPR